ncbi:energy-coupling factor transporter transmembrane component T family protein [Thalassobacillus devorans]|uniref:energy-coupling factor transporter transmembrane component T family protein n=1 Tax=Thalassobacillus devorans TaxID=279813 RepID=UPI00048C4B09|nr:energy-coupling factor transporter transmembrane component T [Thalassobacillus devorans]
MNLQELNPSMKAITIILAVFLLAFVFDPITPLLFSSGVVTLTFLFGRVSLKSWSLYFVPFLIIAFGFFWTTLLFGDVGSKEGNMVTIGFVTFSEADLQVALSLSLRVLSFALLSLMFILTTNKTGFLLSLMQQLKLSPKIAYGVLAGYRFLPMMMTEWKAIRMAHRIRGLRRGKGISGRVQEMKRYVIPLLASAIRKAERTAIAMESKGFTGSKERTFYRQMKITLQDWVFLGVMLSLYGISVYCSVRWGYFQWYDGQL